MFRSFLSIVTTHAALCAAFNFPINLLQGIGDPSHYHHYMENFIQQQHRVRTLYDRALAFNDHFFTQKLDHSRPTDNTTWEQRYFVNDLYYENGSPVFLFVFGETEAAVSWMKGGQWLTYAKKVNALCFGLEHRYYGSSKPTADTTVENLVYLNSQQALADIAYFIEGMNERNNFAANTKWILFGGSYSGSLVAWARQKYPHLVFGAIASSAPIVAKSDFYEYFESIKNTFDSFNPKCSKNIMEANKQLKLAIQSDSGRANVSDMFKLCDRLTEVVNDIISFFEVLGEVTAYAAQYNSDMLSISEFCDIMTENTSSPLQRYANVTEKLLVALETSCWPSTYTESLKYFQRTDYDQPQAERLWFYQTCTEFGFYLVSNKKSDLFGKIFPLDYFVKKCKDVFGPRFDEKLLTDAVNRTNIDFGGLLYNSSNVAFIYGSLDPWRSLGILKKAENAQYDVILVDGTSHCADMYSSMDDDSEELKAARRETFEILFSWLYGERPTSRDGKSLHPKCLVPYY